MAAPPRTPLAEGKVFYVGQPVAAVVAETRQQAQDAAELVADRIRGSARVVDPRKAIAPGAPLLWEAAGRNVAAEAALRRSQQQLKRRSPRPRTSRDVELHNQRLNAMAMEPRCAIGVHEGGRTTLYTQNQTADRRARPARRGVRRQAAGVPRDQRRHRRRLRHEDRPYAGGRAGVLRGAQARPAGEVARRARRGVPRRAHGARPALSRRRWRSIAKGASSRCAWRCSPTSARCRSARRR